jgi:hypothetical protein
MLKAWLSHLLNRERRVLAHARSAALLAWLGGIE